MVIANAASLDVSYFARFTPEQIAAVRNAPNQLVNLYQWINGKHPTPVTYSQESPTWAGMINAHL